MPADPLCKHSCRLRKASRADLPALYEIESLAGFNRWSEEQIRQSLDQDSVWLLDQEGVVVAYAVFYPLLDETELLNLVVHPEFQRQGLASGLLSRVLLKLKQAGQVSCFLEVGQENRAALNLYRKLGFSQVGLRKAYYKLAAGVQDALVMQKIL